MIVIYAAIGVFWMRNIMPDIVSSLVLFLMVAFNACRRACATIICVPSSFAWRQSHELLTWETTLDTQTIQHNGTTSNKGKWFFALTRQKQQRKYFSMQFAFEGI